MAVEEPESAAVSVENCPFNKVLEDSSEGLYFVMA